MSGYVGPDPSAVPLDVLPQAPPRNALQDYVDQLSALHGFTGAVAAPSSWPYASNPVGTETTQSMGVPSAADDPVAFVSSSGVPIMRSDMDRAHAQLAAAMQVAPAMVLGMVGDAPGGQANALRVYHGTPHLFPPVEGNPLGAFDASKIGTGEGAQVYGAGAAYVAEHPGTAKSYRESVVGEPTFDMTGLLGDDVPEHATTPASTVKDMLSDVLRDHPALEHIDEDTIGQAVGHVVDHLAGGGDPGEVMQDLPRSLRTQEGREAVNHAAGYLEDAPVNYAGPTVGGTPFNADDPMHKAAVYVHEAGGDPDAAIGRLDDELETMQERAALGRNQFGQIPGGHYDQAMQNVMQLKNIIDQQRGDLPAYKPPGHMYEADLLADPETMLHWDRAFSQQSPQVQTALRSMGLGPEAAPSIDWQVDTGGRHTMTANGRATSVQFRPSKTPGGYDVYNYAGRYSGWTPESQLEASKTSQADTYLSTRRQPDQTGQQIYRDLTDKQGLIREGAQVKASQALSDAGINGIRYVDQFSRSSTGKPTHNFVVFSPQHLNIVKRYGIGALIPGAGATGLLAGGNDQQ